MESQKLLVFILDSLKSVRETSIGEGNFGIVVDRFPHKDLDKVCAKYAKFSYNPNEYPVLAYAHKNGLDVPEPIHEFPEHKVFAMQRIIGKNLKELHMAGYRFSEDVIEEIVASVRELCRYIEHNDLAPRNIMVEDIVVEDGVVIEGVPYIIDFGKARIKNYADNDTSEAEGIHRWLLNKIAREQ